MQAFLTTLRPQRGFTLIELMIVVSIVGIASGLAIFALRGQGQRELDDLSVRVIAALEQGRLQSRATGVALHAEFRGVRSNLPNPQLTFEPAVPGLVPLALPADLRWKSLTIGPTAGQELGASGDVLRVSLGPEPLVDAQRIKFSLKQNIQQIGTDGLRPFSILP